MPTLNEVVRDLQLRRAILEDRVLQGHLRQLDAIFRQAKGQMRQAILAADAATVAELRRADLTALLAESRGVFAEWRQATVAVIEQAASDAAVMGLEWWNQVLSNQLPQRFAPFLDITEVNPAFIDAAASWPGIEGGGSAQQWGAVRSADFSRAVRLQAAQAAGFGETVGQLAARLVAKFENLGLAKAREMARGVFIYAGGRVADRWAKQNARLIDTQQWVATLDDRTCPRCGALDGEVFPIGDHPPLPLHPNCRCAIVPVLKSWRDLGIDADDISPGLRASMNGEVPADLTFSEWLGTQPRGVQVSVLGKGKAEKWLADGKPDLGNYTDGGRRVLRLDELLEDSRRQLSPDLLRLLEARLSLN